MAKCAIVTEDGWCLHYAGEYEATTDRIFVNRNFIGTKPEKEKIDPALYYLPDDSKENHDIILENEQVTREIHRCYVDWLTEANTPEEHIAGRRTITIQGRIGK